jgi:hypothetical protein
MSGPLAPSSSVGVGDLERRDEIEETESESCQSLSHGGKVAICIRVDRESLPSPVSLNS